MAGAESNNGLREEMMKKWRLLASGYAEIILMSEHPSTLPSFHEKNMLKKFSKVIRYELGENFAWRRKFSAS
ncbi:hypothetical protein U9M48_042468 [Paspalum notatum var. saurae]|uniref:Uncharacterized protein n=1 Tax=Paspalum notatum var. saurae TaxID=547442 RepID=A0AAQ3UQL1_PASNO